MIFSIICSILTISAFILLSRKHKYGPNIMIGASILWTVYGFYYYPETLGVIITNIAAIVVFLFNRNKYSRN